MNMPAATGLVELWTKIPDLVPPYWNTYEPVKRPFPPSNVEECAKELIATGINLGAGIIFAQRKKPGLWGSISLWRRPTHNEIHIALSEPSSPGSPIAFKFKEFVDNCVRHTRADFACISDATKKDQGRFKELDRPFTAKEILQGARRAPPFIPERGKDGRIHYWYHSFMEEMYGPAGHLWDIVWYNYFGPPYVKLIGRDRLANAGWARVEKLAGGLACLATERIDDSSLPDRREHIRNALREFVWTPGCKREDKRAPVFDFSKQLAHAPVRYGDTDGPLIVFAGLSKKEKEQAIKALEKQTGKTFDRASRSLKPREAKK